MISIIKEDIPGMEFIHKNPIFLIRSVGSNEGFIICIKQPTITYLLFGSCLVRRRGSVGVARCWFISLSHDFFSY